MKSLTRIGVLMVSLMGLSSVASSYYHWTYFTQRTGAFTPVRLRFDLNTLPGQTVSFFLPRKGPAKMVDGDSYRSLTQQLRRAGETWNTPTSALQVRFGGYTDQAFADVLTDNALEAFISRLRKKLLGSGASIRTLRGLGYRVEEET